MMSDGGQTKDLKIRKAAIELVNTLLSDDANLERMSDHRTTIASRLANVRAMIETQQLQMQVLAQQRHQKYTYIADNTERALWRAKEAVKLVETVSTQVADIVGQTEKLSDKQKYLINLITRLERLRSFSDNVDRLEGLLTDQRYEGIAGILLATQQFAEQFADSSEVLFISEQLGRFAYLQKLLQRQIQELFESTMRRRGSVDPAHSIVLGRAAVVVDVLGVGARQTLIRWYCDRQLGDYKDVFRGNRELASLQSIPKRYAWLKRLLVVYEAEHSVIFPHNWKVEEALCVDFCAITSRDIADIMQSTHGSKVDLSLLQAAVQQTRAFEQFLYRKYAGTKESGLAISPSFEPFLSYFIEAHDADLGTFRSRLPTKLSIGDFDSSNVLASAPELFMLFREVLQDIAELSIRRPLVDLCGVFNKHLGQYSKYLEERIPKVIKKPLGGFELRTLCVLLNTADYCGITTNAMVERILEIIHPHYAESVAFDGVQQEFLVHISVGIGRLHSSITTSLEPAWSAMTAINWATISQVGDHSNYVSKLNRTLSDIQPTLRSTLVGSKHYVALCHRLAASMSGRFSDSSIKLKPMNEAAAQQLLVDLDALRAILLDMLRMGDYGSLRAQFAKLITSETADIEGYLKSIMAPATPIAPFVQNYLLVRADCSESKFTSLLEAKGIKRPYTIYLEEFRRHVPKKPSAEEPPAKELKFFRLDEQLKKLIGAVKL